MKKLKKTPSLLIYGGTFSPVHCGHLHTALAVQRHMHFDEFVFLPCSAPVLDKPVVASAADRVAMLRLALASYPRFRIDLTEIERTSSSFTVDTLLHYRAKRGFNVSITCLIGMDNAIDLPRWSRWQSLLQLAHLFVVERTGYAFDAVPPTVRELFDAHETDLKTDLLTEPYGKIYRFNAGHYPVSSTLVREAIVDARDTSQLIPACVQDYIQLHRVFDVK